MSVLQQAPAYLRPHVSKDQYTVQVWTFILSDAKFKTNFTNSSGPTSNAPEVTVDKVQIVCVDAKMFDSEAGAS